MANTIIYMGKLLLISKHVHLSIFLFGLFVCFGHIACLNKHQSCIITTIKSHFEDVSFSCQESDTLVPVKRSMAINAYQRHQSWENHCDCDANVLLFRHIFFFYFTNSFFIQLEFPEWNRRAPTKSSLNFHMKIN